MNLAANIFDVWVFQRRPGGIVFLLLHTSVEKATRYFNGGRFWQIPSDAVNNGESITDAICRVQTCLERVHYRGLKDGLRSVHEYITGVADPARELCLYIVPGG